VITRRQFVLALSVSALAAPLAVFAQQQRPVPRIGLLISEPVSGTASRIEALRAGLRDRGYVEGKNIVIEIQAADGNYDRLPELAAALARLKVDVLVAFGSKAASAARHATATVPVVFISVGDPVALGYVSDLARPEGNVTGLATLSPDLAAKQLELLKEAIPRISSVAATANPANPSSHPTRQATNAAATRLKLDLKRYEVREPKDFDTVFSAIVKARADAVLVSADTLFRSHDNELAALAAKHRLPSIGSKEYAQAGGLIGYSVDDAALFRRGAYFVERILKGARPSDLPVERATRFEVVINLKTAKALGLTIPKSLLLRADEVIQ
jgi:putative ABC transport system substrate-binding protein